jgi:GDP-L-fucose synthase
MQKQDKIYIAGHTGMVGSAILRKLKNLGYENFVLKTSSELDLRDQDNVTHFFKVNKPDYVFLAAAKVGGILANSTQKADFIYDNLMIQSNIIHASYIHNVKKLLFLGSSCIYPKFAKQPIKENELLTGSLEPTNDAYAIAKIAGIKMCESYREQYGCNFISAIPCNLYGTNDNYDLKTSHVIPALIRKFHEAKESGLVEAWGKGSKYDKDHPRREFMHVDDLAEACIFLMKHYHNKNPINVGTEYEIDIADLVDLIHDITEADCVIRYDNSKPQGVPRKVLDTSKIQGLGWNYKIGLTEGLKRTYKEFKEYENNFCNDSVER